MVKPICVVALGGNALLRKGQKQGIVTQQKNADVFAKHLLPVVKNHRVVLTHGNGPQVGNIVIRVEEALGKAYKLPLDVCVAESEGEIGYVLEQALINSFCSAGIKMPVATLLTQVIVDAKDPAFKNPSKPIGPFYSSRQIKVFKKKKWPYVEDSGRGYRRVVASPKPLKIVENIVIQKLLSSGVLVIAAGGGGIPVIQKRNKITGIEAVIDKDWASSCLARSIKSEVLLFLTSEDCVYLNYGKRNQKKVSNLTVKEALSHYSDGQFPEGSMGPKILAAVDFLLNGGKKAIITSPSCISKALRGKAGTIITKR